jgi:predicted RNA polymerase sigma factor
MFLKDLISRGSRDPMAFYGLAMEFRSLGLHEDALATFTALRESHRDYVAMYLMCGQLLEQMGRQGEARGWYEAGIQRAREAHNAHAASELEGALAALA